MYFCKGISHPVIFFLVFSCLCPIRACARFLIVWLVIKMRKVPPEDLPTDPIWYKLPKLSAKYLHLVLICVRKRGIIILFFYIYFLWKIGRVKNIYFTIYKALLEINERFNKTLLSKFNVDFILTYLYIPVYSYNTHFSLLSYTFSYS